MDNWLIDDAVDKQMQKLMAANWSSFGGQVNAVKSARLHCDMKGTYVQEVESLRIALKARARWLYVSDQQCEPSCVM